VLVPKHHFVKTQAKWAAFLNEVKEKYKTDNNVTIFKWGSIVFEQGEHPSLESDGHRFRRFSSKITGSHCGHVQTYLDEVKMIAKRHFGGRVIPWSELAYDNECIYGWKEVYDARDGK